ncbi:MAG: alpha/beta hydrolase [Oscillospiraceae bacterium]|nr:alpha/beta hydrolase [Oscillospiraceae bacterium]
MIQKVNQVSLYYEKSGSGRPLLMVHGNGEDHFIFREAIEILKQHFTVYALDSRDHGRSSRVTELHYEDMAEDVVQFLEALDLRDVVFYGFSDGGIIGLLAARKTDRIGRLIISGANLTPDGVMWYLKLLICGLYLVKKDQKLRLMLTEPNIRPEDLAEITIPVTVIAGKRDVIREKETRSIAEAIPNARLILLPGEGHGSYIIHKTKIADIILRETE